MERAGMWLWGILVAVPLTLLILSASGKARTPNVQGICLSGFSVTLIF